MATRKEICDKALEYLGTKFVHQGRLKGVGVDCAGLVVGVAKELNLFKEEVIDLKGYSRVPDGNTLYQTLINGTSKEKNINDLKYGDIILFRFTNFPQHVGIYMPNNKLIHSYESIGKVVIHDLDNKWKNRIVSVFEYLNVIEE